MRKTDVPKTCRKSKFLGKKIWRNALDLKSKKVQGIFGNIWHYCLQLSFVYKTVSQISFNLFCSEIKHDFVDERALITMTLISCCHWKTLVPFCLWKKTPENVFLTLIVNYRKIVQKNKLCHPKQQYIGYLMIYAVIYSLLILFEKLTFFNKQL